MDVDKLAFDLEQERQAMKETLHDVFTRVEKLEGGFSSLEHCVTKMEGGQTSALHLETANAGMKQSRFYVCFCFIFIHYSNHTKVLNYGGCHELLPPKV